MEEEDRRALFHDTAALVYKFVVPPVSLAMPAQHEEGAAATAATTEPSAAEAEAASEATV